METRVVVFVKGGLVQDVISNQPVDLMVVDQDTEGADEEDTVLLPCANSDNDVAFVSLWSITADSHYTVKRYFDLMESKTKEKMV